jgi:capsid assembly protease
MSTIAIPQLPRFCRTGLLALEPSAFGAAFTPAPAPAVETIPSGRASVIRVKGPLTYDGGDCQSYAAILAAADAAFAAEPPDVILHVSSPGGEVFGAFDAARSLRDRAKAKGKRLIAFTEANMQSAGYALASAASVIVCSDVASVGSIGVMSAPAEMTRADAAMGISFEILTSGARKADGNPHVKMTAEARAAMQESIDVTAEVFFALVRESRSIDAKALEAATFVGAQAKAAGLVDHVMSWDALCAAIGSGSIAVEAIAGGTQGKQSMAFPEDKDETREALSKAAADPDEKKAAKAKAALAAWDGPDKDAAADEPEKDAAADEPAKAADEAPAKKDDDKEKDAKASASASASLAATVQSQANEIASLKARNESIDRAAFFATRPDLAPELVKSLAALSLAQAKTIVSTIPVPAAGSGGNPFVVTPKPLQGRTPDAAHINPTVADVKPEIARLMGLAPAVSEHVSTGQIHYSGVMPAQAQ